MAMMLNAPETYAWSSIVGLMLLTAYRPCSRVWGRSRLRRRLFTMCAERRSIL
jgi:hypothetical protein